MSYLTTVLADNPGGYWRLGEQSGLTAIDFSGNGHNGTYTNGPILVQPGLLLSEPGATSVRFAAASSQYMEVADTASIDPGDVFTLEGWLKRTSDVSNFGQTVCSKSYQAGTMYISDTGILTLAKSQVSIIAESTIPIPLTDRTNSYYCVITKNGSSVHLYLNAVDVTGPVVDATCITNTFPFRASSDSFGDGNPVTFSNFYLQEIATYPTALSAARVAAHYLAGSQPVSAGPPQLVRRDRARYR